ncbi:MAG: ATP-binding protein, partial [Pseudomonadota bacterium]
MRLETNVVPGPTPLLAAAFDGTPEGVREALKAMRAAIAAANGTDEELASAEIVIAEALNNVVEHSLADLQGGHFNLSIDRLDSGVGIKITDRG